jgi:hypothetical protein
MAKWASEKKKEREAKTIEAAAQAGNAFHKEFIRHAKFKSEAFGRCALCTRTFEPYSEFRDATARLEYLISLTCQSCQDSVFSPAGG